MPGVGSMGWSAKPKTCAPMQIVYDPGPIGSRRRMRQVDVVHPVTNGVVKQDGNFARRGGDRLGFADARREPPTPNAVSVRPTVTAASRKSAAARLPERRVRDESTLPPEILLLGARHN